VHVCAMAVPSMAVAFICFCNRRRQYCFTDASKQEKSNSEKEIIEAHALSRNASCSETVARVTLLLAWGGGS